VVLVALGVNQVAMVLAENVDQKALQVAMAEMAKMASVALQALAVLKVAMVKSANAPVHAVIANAPKLSFVRLPLPLTKVRKVLSSLKAQM